VRLEADQRAQGLRRQPEQASCPEGEKGEGQELGGHREGHAARVPPQGAQREGRADGHQAARQGRGRERRQGLVEARRRLGLTWTP
jgi:hypothetical protein